MVHRLQRLMIFQQEENLLVLRQMPNMEWIFSIIFFVVGAITAAAGYDIAAVLAWGVCFIAATNARIQYLVFDRDDGHFTVARGGLTGRKIIHTIPLKEITMAYLYVDDDGASQIVLLLRHDMFGLSQRFKTGYDWKEQIVRAVNHFLRIDPSTLSLDDLPYYRKP